MAFDQVLKKNFWAALLVPVAAVAFLNADGIMQLVGANLAVDEKQLTVPSPLARAAAPAASSAPFHVTSAEAILSRNPFDSVTGPLNAQQIELPANGGPEAQGPDMSDPMNAPPCDGIKVLVIAASSDPEWSFAALQSGNDPKSVLRRRGGEVGTKTVKFVGWDRVWLSGGTQLCQASMFAPPAAASAAPPPAAAPPAAGGGPGALDPAIAKGIQKVSATEFNVDRGVVDKILENQADLMRQARIVPEQENGKMVGIRLFGVRPDTLLGVLGMENGDRLQTINGFDMTSPEKALEAYARLRTADQLVVQVNRKGSNMNLDYNIK
jgi:general secretion pathway protein C